MSILVRTPDPHITESPLGYILRLSEENGYDTPSHVMKLAGIYKGFNVPHLLHEPLSKILCKDPCRLKHISYYRLSESGKYVPCLLGHVVHERFFLNEKPRTYRPSLCIQCVAEEGYIDAFFDLRLSIACPKHGCFLTEKCFACKQPLSWYRPGLLICRCGANLTDIDDNFISSNLKDLMAVVRQKLHSQPLTVLNLNSNFATKYLDEIPMASFIRIVNVLAQFGMLTQSEKSSKIELLETVAGALSDWPNGFHDYLSRIGNFSIPTVGTTTVANQWFRNLYNSLFRYDRYREYFNFLRYEYLRFGVRKWKLNIVHKKFFTGIHDRDTYSSFLPLADSLDTLDEQSRNPSEDTEPSFELDKADNKVHRTVDAFDFSETTHRRNQVFTIREAARLLGLPCEVLCKLRNSAFIIERNIFVRKSKGVDIEDIYSLRKAILERSTLQESLLLPYNSVSLIDVLLSSDFPNSSSRAAFVCGYLEGKIRSLGRWGPLFQDIYFDRTKVQALSKISSMGISAIVISKRSAAKILQCSEQTISSLLSANLITELKAPHRHSCISMSSLQQFSSKYVSLRCLAAEWKTSVKRLIHTSNIKGISLLRVTSQYDYKCSTPFISKINVSLLKDTELRLSVDESLPIRVAERSSL